MNKRFLSSVALAALVLPVLASANFRDVSSADAHAEAITYVESQGIVSGYPDGTFQSRAHINRAEFTKIIVESLFQADAIAACDVRAHTFSDIDASSWYARYVCMAKVHGMIDGYPDGSFKPEATINVAESSKILAQAYEKPVTHDASVWYKGYVMALIDSRAMPNDVSSVGALLSRGQMAEMVFRLHAQKTDRSTVMYDDIAGDASTCDSCTLDAGVSAELESDADAMVGDDDVDADADLMLEGDASIEL